MKRAVKTEDGLTLIELLVAAGLLAVVITATSSLFVQGNLIERQAYGEYVLVENGQKLLYQIGSGFTYNGISLPGLFAAQDVETAEGILVYRGGDYEIAYYQDGENLYRRVEEWTGSLNTEKSGGEVIQDGVIRFDVEGRELVNIELVLKGTANQNRELLIRTKVKPRNLR